jgi:probable HAF family extracellular repeat protein
MMALLLLLGRLGPAAALTPQADPRLTVFVPTGGSPLEETVVTDVSDDGRALGRTLVNGVPVILEWTVSGGMQPVNYLPHGPGRGNDLGDVVIPGGDPGRIYHPNGTTTLIPPLGGAGDTALYDVNDSLLAVGWASNTGSSSAILVWDPLLGSRSIFIPAASSLQRVNAGTLAVGNVRSSMGSSDGFVVDVMTGAYVTFNTLLGGAWSEAVDVNDFGWVTGTISHGALHEAFIWHPLNGFTFLPGLKGGSPMYVQPKSVDNAGRVVGSALTANEGNRAFSWDAAGGMVDLNDLLDTGGFLLDEATDVSETGVVIGRCHLGPNWGPSRGFVLEPLGAWRDLGHALAGAGGPPRLRGTGTLESGTDLGLEVEAGRPPTLGLWMIGFAEAPRPFRGGTAVPRPDRLLAFTTDAAGAASFLRPTLPALPPGFTVVAQAWLRDPSGPQGVTASNAVLGTVP